MNNKTVQEQFRDFTELFSADGYQFLKMRALLESIEKSDDKTDNEKRMLEAFSTTARLCRYFLDMNDN